MSIRSTKQSFYRKKNSHQRCSVKKPALKNFALFTGILKPVLKFLFNKVAGTKKGLQYRCFSVNIAKFLRAPICGYCETFKNIYFKSSCSAFISSWRLSCKSSKLLSQNPVSVRLSDYWHCSSKEIFHFLIKVMVAITKF